MSRKVTLARKTAETDVNVTLDLDGSGRSDIDTSVAFFDHMMTLFAAHGHFDLTIAAKGDGVDTHHVLEDLGIVLGQAFSKALGDKAGITRCVVSVGDENKVMYLAGYGYLNDNTFDGAQAQSFLVVRQSKTNQMIAYQMAMRAGISGETHDGALCKNAGNADFEVAFDVSQLYTEDIYDIVDVSKMAVGDTFEAEGKTITVETIERDEFGHINLNGGMDAEGGYTLTSEDDTNGWTTLIWDDFCTYTERGTLDLTLAENVTLNDSWDIDGEAVTATGIEAVTKAIMESANDSFYEHNTELVIEDGKVTEINRHYVP